MKRCTNCKHWCPLKDNPQRGTCNNPERNDKIMVHYFGSLKCTDYCALHEDKKEKQE